MLSQNRRTAQMFIALWHSLETFIFVFCNLSKSPNDKKNTFVQWYPLVCKRIFPIVTNINSYQISREVYILAVLFIFVHSSWYSGLFLYLFYYFYLFYRILITFVFSSRYSRFTPACLGINFLWVRHHPNTEHPICQFCAAFSISSSTLLLFLFLTLTFYFSQSRPYSILWRHYFPYIWK